MKTTQQPKIGDMFVMIRTDIMGFPDIPPNQICRILYGDGKYQDTIGAYVCEMVFYPELTFTIFCAIDVKNQLIRKI